MAGRQFGESTISLTSSSDKARGLAFLQARPQGEGFAHHLPFHPVHMGASAHPRRYPCSHGENMTRKVSRKDINELGSHLF